MTATKNSPVTQIVSLQAAAHAQNIVEVPLSLMTIDDRFQRGVNWPKVYSLVGRKKLPDGSYEYGGKWNRIAAGTFIGNMREDNTISILDGQHRMQGALLVQEMTMPVALHWGLTFEEEAAIFVQCNTNRARPKSGEIMRAQIAAGDLQAMHIADIVAHCGYDLQLTKIGKGSAKSIRAVFAVKRLFDRGVLEKSLRFMSATWPADERVTEGEFMVGLGLVLQTYPSLEVGDFAEKMRITAVDYLIANGNARAKTNRLSENVGIAQAIVYQYNTGKRTRRVDMSLIDATILRAVNIKG